MPLGRRPVKTGEVFDTLLEARVLTKAWRPITSLLTRPLDLALLTSIRRCVMVIES